jgi:hypothetical protein
MALPPMVRHRGRGHRGGVGHDVVRPSAALTAPRRAAQRAVFQKSWRRALTPVDCSRSARRAVRRVKGRGSVTAGRAATGSTWTTTATRTSC